MTRYNLLHASSFGNLLLRCCRGEEGLQLRHQRPGGEEILPHWSGQVCRLEHSHRNSVVHEFDSVVRNWGQSCGRGWDFFGYKSFKADNFVIIVRIFCKTVEAMLHRFKTLLFALQRWKTSFRAAVSLVQKPVASCVSSARETAPGPIRSRTMTTPERFSQYYRLQCFTGL